ncbi:unnamed protein product, partial [Iphiclides podalirius]
MVEAQKSAMPSSQESKVIKNAESVKDRYKNCALLYLIQHIDIHGTLSSSYNENRRRCADNSSALAVTSVTSSSPKFLDDAGTKESAKSAKWDKFTVSTKVSSLYPGHDILSKKRKQAAATRAAV